MTTDLATLFTTASHNVAYDIVGEAPPRLARRYRAAVSKTPIAGGTLMNVPNTDFTLAGTLDELKAKGRLVVHGAHRPILVVHDRGGAYIACTNPNYRANEPLRRWVQAEPDWSYLELATGHDAMILAPDALSEMLMKE